MPNTGAATASAPPEVFCSYPQKGVVIIVMAAAVAVANPTLQTFQEQSLIEKEGARQDKRH